MFPDIFNKNKLDKGNVYFLSPSIKNTTLLHIHFNKIIVTPPPPKFNRVDAWVSQWIREWVNESVSQSTFLWEPDKQAAISIYKWKINMGRENRQNRIWTTLKRAENEA